ncbi:MAG: PhzF family phenazine biosynthesis protein [Bacteroidota bacterium]
MSQTIPVYQVDAFASRPFTGNPAAVCPLPAWLPDAVMQSIAAENNLSETAFFVQQEDKVALRWFTPAKEIDLCGHATLASAHVLFHHLEFPADTIYFDTQSGLLTVQQSAGMYKMDFPSRPPKEIQAPSMLFKALGIEIEQATYVGMAARDLLVVLDDEAAVAAIQPDFRILQQLDPVCVIVSARGVTKDFVSRVFAPKVGVDEDPVTGSAHCTLIPYWAKTLGKTQMSARQISLRGGDLLVKQCGVRVRMTGQAVTVMEGRFYLDEHE